MFSAKKLLWIIVMCLPALVNAQHKNEKLQGQAIENRLLTWDDFKGPWKTYTGHNKEKRRHVAFTSTTIRKEWLDNPNKVPHYKAVCYFLRRSAVSKSFLKRITPEKSAYGLKHEQNHYDLARLAAIEINNTLNTFSYSIGHEKQQEDAIFHSIYKKMRFIQRLYDKESKHSIIRSEQERWDAIIAEAMKNNKLPTVRRHILFIGYNY